MAADLKAPFVNDRHALFDRQPAFLVKDCNSKLCVGNSLVGVTEFRGPGLPGFLSSGGLHERGGLHFGGTEYASGGACCSLGLLAGAPTILSGKSWRGRVTWPGESLLSCMANQLTLR